MGGDFMAKDKANTQKAQEIRGALLQTMEEGGHQAAFDRDKKFCEWAISREFEGNMDDCKYSNDSRFISISLYKPIGVDAEGNQPLAFCAKHGLVDGIIKIMTSENQNGPHEILDINHKNKAGKTALEVAVENGNLDCVKAIVENHSTFIENHNSAGAYNEVNLKGYANALEIAVGQKNHEIAEFLVDNVNWNTFGNDNSLTVEYENTKEKLSEKCKDDKKMRQILTMNKEDRGRSALGRLLHSITSLPVISFILEKLSDAAVCIKSGTSAVIDFGEDAMLSISRFAQDAVGMGR